MDLENSGEVLVLTSVTRKDSGIYQCRPQDAAAAAAEVRGEMQLSVHCEEDTRKTSQHSSRTIVKAPVLELLNHLTCPPWFQSWTRLWLSPKIPSSC